MTHVCDTCGETYPNGSDAMLSGCESCGGTTFQYVDSLDDATTDEDEDEDIVDGDDEYIHPMTMEEDDAQQNARNQIIESDELEGRNMNDVESIKETFGSNEPDPERDGNQSKEEQEESDKEHTPVTDPDAVRNELTNQFESIRILEPGEYELNLRGLYEQENRIIRVKEDGRYVIQLGDDDDGSS